MSSAVDLPESAGKMSPAPAALGRAYRLLIEEDPRLPQRLVIAGGRGHYAPALEALVAALGLTSRVVFLGSVDRAQLVALYQNASVFISPPMESFSLPLLEAMACGTPVVASNAVGRVGRL